MSVLLFIILFIFWQNYGFFHYKKADYFYFYLCVIIHIFGKVFKICNNDKDIKNATSPLDYTELLLYAKTFHRTLLIIFFETTI